MIPSQATVLTEQVETFLAHREVIGIVGLVALVFFSSTAFTVIESAMAIIFYHRTVAQHRHFLVSMLLPYLFMTLIGVGLLLITVISGALHAVRASARCASSGIRGPRRVCPGQCSTCWASSGSPCC